MQKENVRVLALSKLGVVKIIIIRCKFDNNRYKITLNNLLSTFPKRGVNNN